LLLVLVLPWPLRPGPLPARDTPFPPGTPESQGLDRQAVESLRRRVQAWVRDDRIVGAELLVIKNRRTVMHDAFGWKNRERKERMEPDTLFNIRSMTKPLVGMAARILMEEGGLAPDRRVAEFLPAFRTGDAAKITVEHLLTHRSGLPVSLPRDSGRPGSSLREVAAAAGAAGPEFEPGTRFQYSDAGADVLGAVVEAVSGRPLDVFLESRLFEPIGMADTGFLSGTSGNRLPTKRVAALYGGSTGAWQRSWEPSAGPFYPFPSGSQGVYATPSDYARILALWLDDGRWQGARVLSEDSIRRILTPVSPMFGIGSTAPYPTAFPGLEVWHGRMALLWLKAGREGNADEERRIVSGEDTRAARVFGYAGSDGTFAWAWPGEDLMVLFFAQSRGQDVHMELEALLHDLLVESKLLGQVRPPVAGAHSRAPSPGIPDAFRPFVGRYRADFGSHKGVEFTVLFQGDSLAVDIPGQTVFALNDADDEGWRSFKLAGFIAVSFQESPSGKVEAMRLAQTSVFPKKSVPVQAFEAGPGAVRPFLGAYILPAGQGVLTVTWKEGTLRVIDPAGKVIRLTETSAPGIWESDEKPPTEISFITDSSGRISAMTLREIVVLPRTGLDFETRE